MSEKHLVLVGDSIFDNRAYVEAGQSVSEHLQALLGRADRVTLLAVDGHVAGDVAGQLLAMPEGATHIALSVGGNDALESLPALETGCSNLLQALEILGAVQRTFANSYRSALLAALKPGLPLIACTIYDAIPGLPPPLKTALSLFNDVICRHALGWCSKPRSSPNGVSEARQEQWRHDPTRPRTEPEHAAHAQSGVSRRDEPGGAMDGTALADCTARTSRQDRAPAL